MEIDNISNYIYYKLQEHKTNIIIFINDDYETKKLKTKQYIYKNRKLIIFGFIIAVLLAYITHLENNGNYQPHKQYGGDPTTPEKVTSEGVPKAAEGVPKAAEGRPKAAEGVPKPDPKGESKAAEGGPKPTEGESKAAEGGTKPTEGESKAAEGGTKPTEGETKATEGGPDTKGEPKAAEGGPDPKDGPKPTEGGPDPKGGPGPIGGPKQKQANKAADKAAKKQGMGFLSGFKNINAKGGIFSKIFGAFKSVYQFFIDRIKFILYLFLSLFIVALLLISPIVFMMVVVYYMVKFLLKRQSTL